MACEAARIRAASAFRTDSMPACRTMPSWTPTEYDCTAARQPQAGLRRACARRAGRRCTRAAAAPGLLQQFGPGEVGACGQRVILARRCTTARRTARRCAGRRRGRAGQAQDRHLDVAPAQAVEQFLAGLQDRDEEVRAPRISLETATGGNGIAGIGTVPMRKVPCAPFETSVRSCAARRNSSKMAIARGGKPGRAPSARRRWRCDRRASRPASPPGRPWPW